MRRCIFIFVFVGVFTALIVTVFVTYRGNQARVAGLPDGTIVTFLDVKTGGKMFTTEKPWQKNARKILPRAWQKLIPAPVTGSCGNGTNNITVYLQVQLPTNNTAGTLPWESYVVQDSAGFVYNRNGGYCSFGGGTGLQRVYGLSLRAFPRRQPRFAFQLLDSKGAVMAKFDVPNPTPSPFTEWKPLPLPQTLTNAQVALTLESLRSTGKSPNQYIQPKWQLHSTQTNWSKARARHVTLTDATGNDGPWLSPREPAWKILAQVFRERLQDFSADEYLVLTNIPVPAPGENVFPAQTFDRNGVTLQVQAISGVGAITNANGSGWFMVPGHPGGTEQSTTSDGKITIQKWSSIKPFLLLEAQKVRSPDEIRFIIRDDQGREVKVEESGYSSRSGVSSEIRTYMRPFRPAADAKFLNLEIIVNRPVEFEFMVNPADVQSAKNNSK